MQSLLNTLQRYGEAAGLSVAETLWPTRCAICDLPGTSLCHNCARKLPYIDFWRACPRCGSPYGLLQCCDCNATTLETLHREAPGYDACASAVEFDDYSAKIVRSWKDAGQRSLAYDMACIMAPYVRPEWLEAKPVVVPVPASRNARKRRGFDHGSDLANEVGLLLDLPIAHVLEAPKSKDQRALGKRERISNMHNSFTVKKDCRVPKVVLLTDDVHTTGATLHAAADALHQAGAQRVWVLTFARA